MNIEFKIKTGEKIIGYKYTVLYVDIPEEIDYQIDRIAEMLKQQIKNEFLEVQNRK